MAGQIQLVMYEGYLGDAPELRYTPKGTAVANFRLGSSRSFKTSDGETAKETTWLKVSAWGKLAEIVAEYCVKGSHVIVQGALKPGENGNPSVYQLRNERGWGSSYEVTAEKVRILDSKGSAPSGDSDDDEDALPFD